MSHKTVVAHISSLSHKYGSVDALSDVTLDIPAKGMVGFIGPDGVGKSTLLGLVAGVKIIQTGQVSVLGGDIANEEFRSSARNRIAYMPQGLGRNLYPTLSVFDNIDFFGRLFGQSDAERHAKIDELLKATSMDMFRDRPAGKLSGGMKQKLSLCCALMNDPDLLILDEPTTGVDPLSRRQFWELINNIRSQRPWMNVLVATAYLDEAEGFDWLIAMDGGKVIASGTPNELCTQTGQTNLDDAFIALLPEEKKANHTEIIVPPWEAQPDVPPIIEAEGLTRQFGKFIAVNNVSFRIEKGEIFGFLGSNGCGKSTTMKMLTGLLPASEGTAFLFGKPVDGDSLVTRQNVGYMSQSFSLYGELTVQQNLDLHAQLYHLPLETRKERIQSVLERFELVSVADTRPDKLPLGIKQRLQLAVAVLHDPPLLILDEPTSGVDPVARDSFWQLLIDLARKDGVTIFISTHFMNEAARCDRISLMHAGKVLTVGKPDDIAKARGNGSLEDAFIAYLEDASGVQLSQTESSPRPEEKQSAFVESNEKKEKIKIKLFDFGRLWAYSRREMIELLRDPIRMIFALVGPVVLMIAFGFGISLDIEDIEFAAFDQDKTPESRGLIENFSSSPYFIQKQDLLSSSEVDEQLKSGDVQLVIEIPSGFGRDMLQGKTPVVAAWLDGSMPTRAETIRGYITALTYQYTLQTAAQINQSAMSVNVPVIETRFRYNQSFKSIYAMVPSVIMIMLLLTPAIMSAIAIVREKETGSIANFQSTPITRFEFLIGKQLPYVAIGLVEFVLLLLMALFLFQVPVKGSFFTLALGSTLYVLTTTGFGQLISTFTKTQVTAVFATCVLSLVPAINFSGLIIPTSSLSGSGRIIGLSFPAAWYQPISVGTFTKSLGFAELWNNILMLTLFFLVFLIGSIIFLKKQET